MPRLKKDYVKRTISLDADIDAHYEERFFDSATGKRRHGELSELINKLLRLEMRAFEKASKKTKELLDD